MLIPFRMSLQGMTCPRCAMRVAEALEGAGAIAAHADFRLGEARLQASPTVDIDALADAVRTAGYQPGPVEPLLPEE